MVYEKTEIKSRKFSFFLDIYKIKNERKTIKKRNKKNHNGNVGFCPYKTHYDGWS